MESGIDPGAISFFPLHSSIQFAHGQFSRNIFTGYSDSWPSFQEIPKVVSFICVIFFGAGVVIIACSIPRIFINLNTRKKVILPISC